MKRICNFILTIFMSVFSISSHGACDATSIVATSPSSRFTIHGNGTVTDSKTGLMWQRCYFPAGGENCDQGTPIQAMRWEEALGTVARINNGDGYAGYHDWRLPNAKELVSIFEAQCDEGVNPEIFPNANIFFTFYRRNGVWSNSRKRADDGAGWVLNLDDGTTTGHESALPSLLDGLLYYSVRYVRGGN